MTTILEKKLIKARIIIDILNNFELNYDYD